MARSRRHRLYLEAAKKAGLYEKLVDAHGAEECFVCGRKRAAGGRRLAIDHDHAAMYPRGLLCWRCNRLLEHSITPELLEAMAAYLRAARDGYDSMIAGKRAGPEERAEQSGALDEAAA